MRKYPVGETLWVVHFSGLIKQAKKDFNLMEKAKHNHCCSWKKILSNTIATPEQLAQYFNCNNPELEKVVARYPMRINSYFFHLIEKPYDPVWKQVVPDVQEILANQGSEDPLKEQDHTPVAGIIHRYQNRVLLLATSECAVYCRFCTRKRMAKENFILSGKGLKDALAYIRFHRQIQDVLISGGDPLLLSDDALADIISSLRMIRHVEIIRIGTRTPCVLPQRITKHLVQLLKRFHPLFINTHFNHPSEITPETAKACMLLSNAGIPLGCQTVLLKGINDNPLTMKQLFQKLLTLRIRPYYLHQLDLVRGTAHFRTSIATGIQIIKFLRAHTSGMSIPQYVIDLPDGGGKVSLLPDSVVDVRHHTLLLRNYHGEIFRYPLTIEDRKYFTSHHGYNQ